MVSKVCGICGERHSTICNISVMRAIVIQNNVGRVISHCVHCTPLEPR